MNPFTFGNPIKDPARFIGRKAEIRQIVNRLLSNALHALNRTFSEFWNCST